MTDIRDRIARTVGRISRLTGRGGGTTLPGRTLLAMDRSALERLGGELESGSVLVSATNGKTTTSAMIAQVLSGEGRPVLTNGAGSNMPWGIVTSLLGDKKSIGVFEVDEAWLPEVAEALNPRVIVLGNLFRDQLDRYGETEVLADRWSALASSSPPTTRFVLNADDPMVAAVGKKTQDPVYFGVKDPSVALESQPHAADARRCRECGERLVFELSFLGHLGIYRCQACGMARPEPDVSASNIDLLGAERLKATVSVGGERVDLDLPLPGLYNLYNALAAISAACALDVEPHQAVKALGSLPPVFGRAERLELGETEVGIFLIKNPVGANEVLRSLASDPESIQLWIALNDRIADGRDISWVWDADFEVISGKLRKVICSGTRGAEMALRLKYAGVPPDRITVSTDLAGSFEESVAAAEGELLYALPTYTALLELKDHISRTKGYGRYWEGVEG